MDPEIVKALKLQQEAHNRAIQEQDEFYQARLAEIQEVQDKLILTTIGDAGGNENV